MAYRTRPGESQYAARNRIARAKGFGSYREYRTASAQVRERSTRKLAREDARYARTLDSSTASIRKRAAAYVRGAHGSTLTSTDLRRQYAHVRGAHRAAGGDVDVSVYAVVQMGGFDRRRRDPRRHHGRETGYRTLRFTTTSSDLAADDDGDPGAFADAMDEAMDSELEGLYAGYAGSAYSVAILAVTV